MVNDTDAVEVESYLPHERVKQELDMLHNVGVWGLTSEEIKQQSSHCLMMSDAAIHPIFRSSKLSGPALIYLLCYR